MDNYHDEDKWKEDIRRRVLWTDGMGSPIPSQMTMEDCAKYLNYVYDLKDDAKLFTIKCSKCNDKILVNWVTSHDVYCKNCKKCNNTHDIFN